MSRGWQVVIFVLLLAVPVHSRAQPAGPSQGRMRQVQGSIADSQGRPVGGAEVWDLIYTSSYQASWEKQAVTGETGHFSFSTPRPYAHLWICHPEHIPESQYLESLIIPPLRIVLRPGGKVSGRIVDSLGRPVAGASVRKDLPRQKPLPVGCYVGPPAPPPCDEEGPRVVVSDEAGSFTISPLPPGWYEVGAYAEGYAPNWSKRLEVIPGKKTADVTIVLEPATRLTGRVLDSDGLPVPGAEISTSGECAPFTEQPVRSAEDGSYSMRCIVPGLQRVEIRHPEHSTVFKDVRLTRGDNERDWTLRKRVEVHGRVVKPDGAPVEKAFIQSPDSPGPGVFAESLADGSFTGWVDAGRPQEIWAFAEGNYAEGKATLPASRPGDRIDNVEIRLGEGARLTGRLLGLSPQGAAAATSLTLTARNGRFFKSGKVDAEGRYEIHGLLPGTWEVEVGSGRRTLTERVTVEPGDAETVLDLTLPPVFEVRGRVVPTPNGKPHRGFTILFQNEKSTEVTRTEQDGSFTVRLEAGAYEVKHDSNIVHAGGPVIVADPPPENLEIHLVRGVRLRGRIKGLTPGQPAPRVSAKSSFQERSAQSLPTPDSYVIEGLTPGDWQVKARLDDRVVTSRITIQPGEPLVTLDLDPSFGELTLSGRLAGLGTEVSHMSVELLQADPEISHQPDRREYGIFRFTRLREGSYRLRVQGYSATGWGVLHEQDVELSSDRDVVIDLSGSREE